MLYESNQKRYLQIKNEIGKNVFCASHMHFFGKQKLHKFAPNKATFVLFYQLRISYTSQDSHTSNSFFHRTVCIKNVGLQ